jgi:23S rRNA pseudouridine2604 synthase
VNKDVNAGNEPVRINKLLSDAGVCSRREADRLLEQGKVLVDGKKATIGQRVFTNQKIECNGKIVSRENELILLAFNKPRGIVSSTVEKEGQSVVNYINYEKRIYPIGRLDKDSEGLIFLTNDGELMDKILRSRNNHEKEYIVTVNKKITDDFIKGMSSGVPILDTVTKKCKVTKISDNVFKIILTQGLNRQIRRMSEYFGYKVTKLKRIRILNVKLGDLRVGQYRKLTTKEINSLKEML